MEVAPLLAVARIGISPDFRAIWRSAAIARLLRATRELERGIEEVDAKRGVVRGRILVGALMLAGNASVLAPGGELYFADAHPSFLVLEEHAGRLVPMYDFQTPAEQPLEFSDATTYTGDPTIMAHQSTREWIHSLSAILGALIEVLPWRGVRNLVPASDRLWRLPDRHPRILCPFR